MKILKDFLLLFFGIFFLITCSQACDSKKDPNAEDPTKPEYYGLVCSERLDGWAMKSSMEVNINDKSVLKTSTTVVCKTTEFHWNTKHGQQTGSRWEWVNLNDKPQENLHVPVAAP